MFATAGNADQIKIYISAQIVKKTAEKFYRISESIMNIEAGMPAS